MKRKNKTFLRHRWVRSLTTVAQERVNRKREAGLSTFQGVISWNKYLGWTPAFLLLRSQTNQIILPLIPSLHQSWQMSESPLDGLSAHGIVQLCIGFRMFGGRSQLFSCFIQSGSEVGEKHYTYDCTSDFSLPWKSVFAKTLPWNGAVSLSLSLPIASGFP